MYSTILLSGLIGLAAAAPKPQVINVEAINDLPIPTVLGPATGAASATNVAYDATSAAAAAAAAISTAPAAVQKRSEDKFLRRDGTCATQPDGVGPVPGDGSDTAYLDADSILAQNAKAASTPSGYVESFSNLQGSSQQIGYLTFKTLNIATYDTQKCADFCDSVKYCLGFNIYYERDPSVDPGSACPNPPPVTNLKCSLYGYPLGGKAATNQGQWRGPEDAAGQAFHVVIAGSNGYSKLAPCPTPDTQKNFTGPSALLHGAINAPLDPTTGKDTYLGMKLYNSGPYDPSVCASACQAQTAYDKATHAADGSYKPCNFFNSYILTKNNVPQGTYCSFYTRSWDASYAVNTGYTYGSDVYAVSASFTYSLTTPDAGQV